MAWMSKYMNLVHTIGSYFAWASPAFQGKSDVIYIRCRPFIAAYSCPEVARNCTNMIDILSTQITRRLEYSIWVQRSLGISYSRCNCIRYKVHCELWRIHRKFRFLNWYARSTRNMAAPHLAQYNYRASREFNFLECPKALERYSFTDACWAIVSLTLQLFLMLLNRRSCVLMPYCSHDKNVMLDGNFRFSEYAGCWLFLGIKGMWIASVHRRRDGFNHPAYWSV